MPKKERKIYVVGSSGNSDYINWMEGVQVPTLYSADLVCFTGGEDISPAIYKKGKHPQTSYNISRDKIEISAFNEAVRLNKKIIGICRGSQLLCALNGGILIQHQLNPNYIHNIHTHDGKMLAITSTHHQAAYPFNLPKNQYAVLAWSRGESNVHYGESYQDCLYPEKECEIVYYPVTNSLGIQGHPEEMDYERDTIAYLRDLLDKLMENKITVQNP